MTREELDQIVEKYRNLSTKFESQDEEKYFAYSRFAEFLEGYPRHSGLSDSDSEETLWEHFKEVEEECGNCWDLMFPNGDEEDSITDWMTKN